MDETESLLDVFRLALGANPDAVADARNDLGRREIEAIRSCHADWSSRRESFGHPRNELWPLVSHHSDLRGAGLRNFGFAAEAVLSAPMAELITHLVHCNGVILADPLRRVLYDVVGQPISDPDLAAVRRAAAVLAAVDPLVEVGIVRFSRIHPLLASEERQRWIAPFNLGPQMRTLLNVIEQGEWLDARPFERSDYDRNVGSLLAVCGVRPCDFPQEATPRDRLMSFARALMEVSWQLSNVLETDADLYLTNPLELRVLDVLVEHFAEELRDHAQVLDGPYDQGRHIQMIARTGIPLLDSSKLSFKDVCDIRSGDAFSLWRDKLNLALDTYAGAVTDQGARRATSAFSTEMRLAAEDLRREASKSDLRGALNEVYREVTVGIAAAASTASIDGTQLVTAGVGIGAGAIIASKLWQYLSSRTPDDTRASVRYMAAFNI